jgi:predicted metal-dependent peptidase
MTDKFAIALDTSGGMLLYNMERCIDRLIKVFVPPEEKYFPLVLWSDIAVVKRVHVMGGLPRLALGGGTDSRALVKLVNTELPVKTLVIITDGYFDWAPVYGISPKTKVFWFLTESGPHGILRKKPPEHILLTDEMLIWMIENDYRDTDEHNVMLKIRWG